MARAAIRHRYPIGTSDIQRLGGVVSVQAARDRVESGTVFHVAHISRGGDCYWRSGGIHSEDHADAAARVLAQYFGAEVKIGTS
jgi:hypothetical protein